MSNTKKDLALAIAGGLNTQGRRMKPTDAEMIALIQAAQGDRYAVTVAITEHLRATGYRFDKSWRHAEPGPKADAYARCCTFAANDIADDPAQTERWRDALTTKDETTQP